MRREPLPWFPLFAGLPLFCMLGILWLAGLGAVFQTLMDAAAAFTGDQRASMLYQRVAVATSAEIDTVRLALLVPVHLVAGVAAWPLLRRVLALVRWTTTRIARWFANWRKLQFVLAGLAWLTTMGVAVAFVVQPGLVPLEAEPHARARLANLLDGTASLQTWTMVQTARRRLAGTPIPGTYSVEPGALSDSTLDSPLMTRWDALLRAHTDDDAHYAQTKAFMLVESAGRQYAVSRTGCAGLFQFCVSTAQRRPFKKIFGVGGVSACACGGKPCRVPKDLRLALETDRLALERATEPFPCSSSDARFDPERAVPAGAAFVKELSDDVGGNLPLMYIGYNSGPAVAKKLYKQLGQRSDLTIEDLRPSLATVLTRWYGDRATSRANGLLDVHLPKLERAHQHYLSDD